MGGDEIHAGPRVAATLAETVRGSGEPGCHFGQLAFVAFPVGSDRIAELVVPFRPARRKPAHLITAGSDVPGFGNELDGGEHRVLQTGIQKSMSLVEAVGAP